MKQYTAYITIRGATQQKRFKLSFQAVNDSDATSKAWGKIDMQIKCDDDDNGTGFDNILKIFNGFKK
jgi:hypothetical protein